MESLSSLLRPHSTIPSSHHKVMSPGPFVSVQLYRPFQTWSLSLGTQRVRHCAPNAKYSLSSNITGFQTSIPTTPTAAATPSTQRGACDAAAPITVVWVTPSSPVSVPMPTSPLPGRGAGLIGAGWTSMVVGNQVEYVPPTHDSYHFTVV
jgi:hypothetical protein